MAKHQAPQHAANIVTYLPRKSVSDQKLLLLNLTMFPTQNYQHIEPWLKEPTHTDVETPGHSRKAS